MNPLVQDRALIVCKYFKQGNCHFGDSCHFSHDLSLANVCRYFLKGSCAYGDSCRYDHVRPSEKPLNPASESFKPSFQSAPIPKSSSWESPSKKVTSSQQPSEPALGVDNEQSLSEDGCNPENLPLCPYGVHDGECKVPDCQYLHGDLCEVCQLMILHPFNEELRIDHRKVCEQQFEEDLHYSFAVEASKNKQCGICLETVLEKENPSHRKFGILDCCDHVFCVNCIMSWRQSGLQAMSKDAIRSCPECRRSAKFIMKSDFWCDTAEVKKSLEEKWKANAKKRPCKFWKSEGFCKFGDNCFFSHEGTPGQRRRRLENDRGVFIDEDRDLDFISLLLEATHRYGSLNPSSILFSLSDDDSDDDSLEGLDALAGELFSPESPNNQGDAESDGSEDGTDFENWSGSDDEEDNRELPWLPTAAGGWNSNSNSSSSTLDQPD